jgi:hypothetical protein
MYPCVSWRAFVLRGPALAPRRRRKLLLRAGNILTNQSSPRPSNDRLSIERSALSGRPPVVLFARICSQPPLPHRLRTPHFSRAVVYWGPVAIYSSWLIARRSRIWPDAADAAPTSGPNRISGPYVFRWVSRRRGATEAAGGASPSW